MHHHTIDGQTIYHSHFYAGSADNPQHNHTSQQCKVITALSFYAALVATMAIVVTTPLLDIRTILWCSVEHLTNHLSNYKSLRAPPAFI